MFAENIDTMDGSSVKSASVVAIVENLATTSHCVRPSHIIFNWQLTLVFHVLVQLYEQFLVFFFSELN